MTKNPLRPSLPLLKIQIRFETDIVTARQKTRRLSALLGFNNQDQARIATAASELARNIYQYAGSGSVEFFLADATPQALIIIFGDNGPGIARLDDIFNGTYVSTTGMGVGIMGSKKLMDHFEIQSAPGQGTRITVGKNLDKLSAKITKPALQEITKKLISQSADNPFEEIQNQNRDLLVALEGLRESQDQLSELNRELAETNRGVVALYAELDEKATSLQRANEIKTSFLSNMTHEFRTPLSSIISLTRLLLQRVDGELSEEQEKQVTYIQKSGETLLELVSDLLDLAKVEAGKVSVNATEFMLSEVLSGLRGMFRPILGSDSAVQLLFDGPVEDFKLVTDQAKLSQILRNLVSNALKFTEQGTVRVSAVRAGSNAVHFKITDTGIGIDPAFAEVIFEDFGQVPSKLQSKQKGTGLGLPLSRKLARLLGGELWVESKSGSGSTFHVQIPANYQGEKEAVLISQAPKTKTIESEPGARFNILLIDDDESSRYVLRNLIKAELDASFEEAPSGLLGLQSLRAQRPDLVFLDLGMEEMDGFEVLSAMRRDPAMREIPVIVNTAKKLSPAEQEFLNQSATAILSKERTDEALAVRDLRRALVKAGFDYRSM